jgi:putative phosphonate metabolism protein
MPERFAIYFAPPATSELWQRAAHWLGRDAATGNISNGGIPGISAEKLTALTPSATRYGFHATMKAPMALADGVSRSDLEAALTQFASRHAPVAIGRLELKLLDGFLALTPVVQSFELTEFAGKAVAELDPFRAPMSAEDRAKRLKSKLTPYQIELMDQYGYPYVMDQFLFHMTLTDRMAAEQREPVVDAARGWFAPILPDNVLLDRLSLFHEAEPGAPFTRIADFPLSTKARV